MGASGKTLSRKTTKPRPILVDRGLCVGGHLWFMNQLDDEYALLVGAMPKPSAKLFRSIFAANSMMRPPHNICIHRISASVQRHNDLGLPGIRFEFAA